MNKCNNCCWYCHSDSKCYKPDLVLPAPVWSEDKCSKWSYDGLTEEEREALMTMVIADDVSVGRTV